MNGKFVPFTKSTGKCHYEECKLKPKSEKSKLVKPDRFWKVKGISYKTIQSNTTLNQFEK